MEFSSNNEVSQTLRHSADAVVDTHNSAVGAPGVPSAPQDSATAAVPARRHRATRPYERDWVLLRGTIADMAWLSTPPGIGSIDLAGFLQLCRLLVQALEHSSRYAEVAIVSAFVSTRTIGAPAYERRGAERPLADYLAALARAQLLGGDYTSSRASAQFCLAAKKGSLTLASRASARAVLAVVTALTGTARAADTTLNDWSIEFGRNAALVAANADLIAVARLALAEASASADLCREVALATASARDHAPLSVVHHAALAYALALDGDDAGAADSVSRAFDTSRLCTVPPLIMDLVDLVHTNSLLLAGRPRAALAVVFAQESVKTGLCVRSRRGLAYLGLNELDSAEREVAECDRTREGHGVAGFIASSFVRAAVLLANGHDDQARLAVRGGIEASGGEIGGSLLRLLKAPSVAHIGERVASLIHLELARES